MKSLPKHMRPCVKAAFEKGVKADSPSDRLNKEHLKKMTFAIIYELDRLEVEKAEIKTFLLDWNTRNYRILSPGDAQRQLCDFVDWYFKRECKLSCKALEDYCLFPNGGCAFKSTPYQGEIKLPFSLVDAITFLEKEYRPHGYLMGLLLRTLFSIQKEKNVKNILFIGLRTLRARLNNDFRHCLDLMTILRALNKLEEAGLIRITHGQSGTFGTRHANGYTFISWTRPQETHIQQQPIITHLCNKTETLLCVTENGLREKEVLHAA